MRTDTDLRRALALAQQIRHQRESERAVWLASLRLAGAIRRERVAFEATQRRIADLVKESD